MSINLFCGENYVSLFTQRDRSSDFKNRNFKANCWKLLRKSGKMPGDVGKTNILYEKLHELFFKELKSHFEIPSRAET